MWAITLFYCKFIKIEMEARQSYVQPYPSLQEQERSERKDITRMKTPLELMNIDEGIGSSLLAQLKGICVKFSYVLVPRNHGENGQHLRNWDLWGPFLLSLLFALFIDNSDSFLLLVFSIFLGAIFVTFNVRVLGGGISFFQSVSILGYCVCPLLIMIFVNQLLQFLRIRNTLIRFILLSVGVVWSIFAARAFIGVNIPKDRKFVALYPIILFYAFLGLLMSFQ